MRRFSRLFVVLVIFLSGTILIPYAAFTSERVGWQQLRGVYEPTDTPTSTPTNTPTPTPTPTETPATQPVLEVSPTSLSFEATEGGSDPFNQPFHINNEGTGTLSWSASTDQPWLELSDTEGTAPSVVDASVDIGGLSAGTYNGQITIAAAEASNSPQTVDVTLTVNPPATGPVLDVNPTALNFVAAKGWSEPLTQTISINNIGTGSLDWSASESLSWLSLSEAAGTAPSTIDLVVDASGLSARTYNGSITVEAGSAQDSPQQVDVTLMVKPETAEGDDYEVDNDCADASPIETDGMIQSHTFHASADEDWVSFEGTEGLTYTIEARTPATSTADVVLELYDSCTGGYQDSQGNTFSPDISIRFDAPHDGTYYIRLTNQDPANGGDDVAYNLSVREPLVNPAPGALIVVAGRHSASDELQNNIHNVTDAVYRLFQKHGYPKDRIRYLATDLTLDPDGGGADVYASATNVNLEEVVTEWAVTKVSADRALTIYLVDHGNRDKFYLDKPYGEWLEPDDLDSWIDQLEDDVPGLKVNVIVEACFSGSFVDELSKDGRVVIASTGAWVQAHASNDGANFSDTFIDGLDQGMSLLGAFKEGADAAKLAFPVQISGLDDDGNAQANDQDDGQQAAQRGFAFAGTLAAEVWPPYIKQAEVRDLQDGTGQIWAEVEDDEDVRWVVAVIYPPSQQTTGEEEKMATSPPPVTLWEAGNNWHNATYTEFDEMGEYRILIYAEDDIGLQGRPKLITVQTGYQIYLPLVLRNR